LREEHRLRESENRVQERIFGPKRDEVTGKWRKPHNEELNDLHTGFWWGNLRERDHLEDPIVDGRIIVRWIFRKWDWVGGRIWPGLIGFRIETGGGHL